MRNDNTKKVKPSNLLKRAICYVLTTALVVSGFNMIPGVKLTADAAVASAEKKQPLPTAAGSTLYDGYAYYINSNTTITGANASTSAAGNGLNVESGATAIIYIPKGVTLTVNGGNGSGMYAGGAGISVPSDSTLIVTGQGTLVANGGKGGSAGNGSNGSNGSAEPRGGKGGNGGNGSGGAGAGIGTAGANGGAGVEGGAGGVGNNGKGDPGSSNSGEAASTPGNIYFIGSVTINATGGAAATAATETSFADGQEGHEEDSLFEDYNGAGGKAGESGTATNKAAGIGAGAPGGKSGRSGGGGGSDKDSNGTDSHNHSVANTGANGPICYNGNPAGTCTYNKVSTVTVTNNGSDKTVATDAYGTKATEIVFGINSDTYKGLLSNTTISFFDDIEEIKPSRQLYAMYGAVLPEASRTVTIPKKENYTFLGYFTAKEAGDMVYDANGIIVTGNDYINSDYVWIKPTDTDLYAHWELNSKFNVTFNEEVENDFFVESNSYTNIPTIKITYQQSLTDVCVFKKDDNRTLKPTRVGYEFAGFADALTGGTLIFGADGKMVATDVKSDANGQIIKNGKWVNPGSITLYAQWTPLKYNFTFDKNTGDGNNVTINDVDIVDGYPATVTIAKQSKPGQALLGFSYDKDTDSTSADLASKLIYKASADDITIFEFDKTTVTARPKDDATTTVDESKDITLYAVWGTANYQVAYYDRDWDKINDEDVTIDNVSNTRINEGVDKVNNPQQFKYGQFMLQSLKELKYTAPEIATKNYEFLGWSTEPYAKKADYEAGKQYQGGLTTTPGEIVKLYAVWVKTNGADISFNGNGSIDAPATHVPADDEVIFDKEDEDGKYAEYKIESRYQPIREGYKFLGWSKSATDATNLFVPGETGVTVNIYEDTVFYAQWKANPTISYDAGSGAFTTRTNSEGKVISNAIPAKKYPAGTISDLINIINPIGLVDPDTSETYDAIARPGYTFVGWMATRADGEVDTTTYCSSGSNLKLGYAMPDCDIVFRALWKKNTYTQNVIADKGNDVYSISYTGTYNNNEGTITKLEGNEENAKIGVSLEAGTGENAGKFVGYMADIPHEANVILSVAVDGKYDAENVVVKVNGTVYKPATTTVVTVEDTVAEDKQGTTVYTYRIEDITSTKFNVDISGAVAKEYDVQYKLLNGATLPEGAITSYVAGSENTLPTLSATSKYTFAGWFASEEDAKACVSTKVITSIPTNARGNKTYYAGWVGKTYNITFNELYGIKKAEGSADNANTQTLTFGTETTLKTFAAAFPGTTGPNGATFLGWATSEADAFAKKVTYTDGQNVKDIADADITLYAVWDIDKVTISFDANGGKFQNGNIVDTKDTTYGGTAATAVAAVSGTNTKPTRDGFTFGGWAAKKTDTTQVTTTDSDKLYNDVTYYAIWKAEQHTFLYYKNSAGTGDYETRTTYNGETITIGTVLSSNQEIPVEPNVPEGKRLIGWTTTPNGEDVKYSQGEQILVTSTSGTNLYPVFGAANAHTLTYSANGGSFSPVPEVVTMNLVENTENQYFATTITLAPTREGYVFGGWSEESTDPTKEQIITAGKDYVYNVPESNAEYSHVLYAVWTPITYTVTFKGNKAPVAENDIINKADADATSPVLNTELNGAVKVDDSSYKQIFTYDENGVFVEPQFSYPGYVFKGWAESAEGAVVYKNLQSVKNMTNEDEKNFDVYAVWAMDTPLTVTYRANGGTLATDATEPADQKYARIADTINVTTANAVYVRDGYEFKGWSTSPTTYKATDEIPTTGIYEAGKGYDQDVDSSKTTVTLYAVWQKLPTFKIVYNLNGGAGSVPIDLKAYYMDGDSETANNTVTMDTTTVPTRTGYTFVGWAPAKNADEAKNLTEAMFTYKSGETASFTPAKYTINKETIDAAKQSEYITKIVDENVLNLYAVWKANGYKIKYYQVDKAGTTTTQIGEQEFAYDDTTGKLTAIADMSFTPKVEEGQQSVTNKYTATLGYEFAGWSFKPLGTLSLDDKEPIKNVLTGTENNKEISLYAVEKEKILTVTLDDAFDAEGVGANFKKDDETFFNTGWGKAYVQIKNRAADDKVYTKAEGTEGATALETTGIDNDAHKYFVKYTKALNDITIPSAPGFTFDGYYATVDGKKVMYYDASGNAVKTADFTNDITLTAKWTPVEFQVVFKENGAKIDEMTQTYGQPFKMPNTVKNLSYNADMEVVGWTTSVDNQNPDTASIDGMNAYSDPNKFVLNDEYSAVVIAKLYNNYNADVAMYPVYKTTRKYKVYFSSEDQKNVTNLPETQEVAWNDTFVVKFDDVVMRTPYRKGYTFLGWSKTENPTTAEFAYGDDAKYNIEKVADNIILYAAWAKGEEDVPVSKEEALKRLQDSYDTLMATGNYTGAQAEALTDAYEAGKNAINKTDVKTEEQVEQALADAKSRLAAVENDQQANSATKTLEDAKTNAADRLEDVYDAKNQSDYRAAQQTELTNAKNAGIEAINAATTPEAVAEALANAKKAINSVKTDSTLTKEEEAAAAAAKKAAEEAAAKKAAEEAAAKKAAEEAAAKKAAEEAAAKKAADQAAANAVITKINAIGSPVTADSKSAIDAARNAYNALTADQKQYISQEIVTILTTAEATYKSVTTPKPTYFGEWVNGVWYNADGSQTYGPKGGWKSNSTGWWYEDEVGWYPANCWQKIDGQWYYFDSSGYRAENEWRGGYWLGADGTWTYQPTGSWHLDGYGWWYEDTTGWYPTNCWLKIDGYWYYFGGDGYMLTNQYIDGYWVGADGACQ